MMLHGRISVLVYVGLLTLPRRLYILWTVARSQSNWLVFPKTDLQRMVGHAMTESELCLSISFPPMLSSSNKLDPLAQTYGAPEAFVQNAYFVHIFTLTKVNYVCQFLKVSISNSHVLAILSTVTIVIALLPTLGSDCMQQFVDSPGGIRSCTTTADSCLYQAKVCQNVLFRSTPTLEYTYSSNYIKGAVGSPPLSVATPPQYLRYDGWIGFSKLSH